MNSNPNTPGKNLKKEQRKVVPSNLEKGVAYSIYDTFSNGHFNMVFVMKIPESEIRLRQEYLARMRKPTGKLEKEEIRELKDQMRKIKSEIKSLDKERLGLINKQAVSYKMLKIESNLGKNFI